jgi:vitamin B12 transporter
MRSQLQRLSIAAALAATTALPALAQQPFALDEIVFSANRIATAREGVGSAVTLVGRDELTRAGDQQLSSFLARLPGVTMDQSGPPGTPSSIRIRGAGPLYVAVFVDGIRVDDPSTPQTGFDFGALGTADIGRIEVLRGSQSALWGGSAVGGVINITTLGDDQDGQSAALEGGSFGTFAARYGFARQTQRGAMAFNLSHLTSDGFSAADEADGNTEDDGIRRTRASLSFRHALSDTLTLGAAGFVQRTDNDYDSGFPVEDAPNEARRREGGARVFATFRLGADSTQEVGLSYYRVSRSFSEPAGFFPSDNTYVGERVRLDWVGSTPLNPELTFVYGGDWEREDYDQSGTFGDLVSDTRIAGAFLQALYTPTAGTSLSATARIDDHSEFGSFTTWRLAGAYAVTEALTLRATASRGFRAPSNFELYSEFGNLGLSPERSRSFDIGADLRLVGGASLGVTLFELRLTNAIRFEGAGYENVEGDSRSRGVELEGKLPLGERFDLSANYTYTDARTEDGARFGRVPRHEVGLALDAQLTDRLSNTTTLRAMAGRPEDTGRDMASFAVVNTAFAWALTEQAELTLRIENLFDRQYQLAAGYGTTDRAIYVGVAGRF